MCKGIWEHYALHRIKTILKTLAILLLKEIVEFWDDHLKRRPDGTLVRRWAGRQSMGLLKMA
jgi:alpha-L-fucosidase 2